MAPINMLYLDQVLQWNVGDDDDALPRPGDQSSDKDHLDLKDVFMFVCLAGLQCDTGKVAQYEGAEVRMQIAPSMVSI